MVTLSSCRELNYDGLSRGLVEGLETHVFKLEPDVGDVCIAAALSAFDEC